MIYTKPAILYLCKNFNSTTLNKDYFIFLIWFINVYRYQDDNILLCTIFYFFIIVEFKILRQIFYK